MYIIIIIIFIIMTLRSLKRVSVAVKNSMFNFPGFLWHSFGSASLLLPSRWGQWDGGRLVRWRTWGVWGV